jgi:hypothetical protein
MFKDVYAEAVERVWVVLANYAKGETIPWNLVEAAIGVHRDDRGGRTVIKRLCRRLLRDRQITAFPEKNVGIRLLTDNQAATEVPAMRQKRARRQISRGLKETSVVDLSQLSRSASAHLAMARRHMKAERLAITRGSREAAALLRPAASVSAQTRTARTN